MYIYIYIYTYVYTRVDKQRHPKAVPPALSAAPRVAGLSNHQLYIVSYKLAYVQFIMICIYIYIYIYVYIYIYIDSQHILYNS